MLTDSIQIEENQHPNDSVSTNHRDSRPKAIKTSKHPTPRMKKDSSSSKKVGKQQKVKTIGMPADDIAEWTHGLPGLGSQSKPKQRKTSKESPIPPSASQNPEESQSPSMEDIFNPEELLVRTEWNWFEDTHAVHKTVHPRHYAMKIKYDGSKVIVTPPPILDRRISGMKFTLSSKVLTEFFNSLYARFQKQQTPRFEETMGFPAQLDACLSSDRRPAYMIIDKFSEQPAYIRLRMQMEAGAGPHAHYIAWESYQQINTKECVELRKHSLEPLITNWMGMVKTETEIELGMAKGSITVDTPNTLREMMVEAYSLFARDVWIWQSHRRTMDPAIPQSQRQSKDSAFLAVFPRVEPWEVEEYSYYCRQFVVRKNRHKLAELLYHPGIDTKQNRVCPDVRDHYERRLHSAENILPKVEWWWFDDVHAQSIDVPPSVYSINLTPKYTKDTVNRTPEDNKYRVNPPPIFDIDKSNFQFTFTAEEMENFVQEKIEILKNNRSAIIPTKLEKCVLSILGSQETIEVDNGWIPTHLDEERISRAPPVTSESLDTILTISDKNHPCFAIKDAISSPDTVISQWQHELTNVVARRLKIPVVEVVIDHPNIVNWMLMEFLGVILRSHYWNFMITANRHHEDRWTTATLNTFDVLDNKTGPISFAYVDMSYFVRSFLCLLGDAVIHIPYMKFVVTTWRFMGLSIYTPETVLGLKNFMESVNYILVWVTGMVLVKPKAPLRDDRQSDLSLAGIQ
jgi:hypothetical protein